MPDSKNKPSEAGESEKKVISPTTEQEARNAKQRAEAEEKGGGPRKPEKGLNQDG